MSDLISRKAVKKIIKEFFKTKVDEIPKREKFNKLCELCNLYLELNADLHKEIEDITTLTRSPQSMARRCEMFRKSLYIEVGERGNLKIEIDGQPVFASAIKFEATVESVPQLELVMPFIPLKQEMKAAKSIQPQGKEEI